MLFITATNTGIFLAYSIVVVQKSDEAYTEKNKTNATYREVWGWLSDPELFVTFQILHPGSIKLLCCDSVHPAALGIRKFSNTQNVFSRIWIQGITRHLNCTMIPGTSPFIRFIFRIPELSSVSWLDPISLVRFDKGGDTKQVHYGQWTEGLYHRS